MNSQVVIACVLQKRIVDVKIKQHTSLVIVSCSESELNFSAYEGAFNSLHVQSNGDWTVRSTPEWLRAKVLKGSGDQTISFTALSANKTSIERTGVVVIETKDDDLRVTVNQYGEAIPDCRVTPKHVTTLYNGLAFDLDFSEARNAAGYYRGYMEASETGRMTNPEIISELKKNFKRHLPSEDEVVDFSGLRPNTEYAIYTLAYDIEGRYGELIKTIVKTRPTVVNEPSAWIDEVTYNNSYWHWIVTKSATCDIYWQMATEIPELAYASDVLLAWLLEDAVRRNKETEYCNGGNWQMPRYGNNATIWTRGRNAYGTLAGEISLKSTSTSSPANARGKAPSQGRNAAGDHSGHKLSQDQYQLFYCK